MNDLPPQGSQASRRARERGLTLLELLIVITILAILTTVATRSLVSVGEQAQFESNDAIAKDFKSALIGSRGAMQSDGTALVSGFIADLGRPPRAELESFVVGENEAPGGTPTGQAYTLRELVIQRNAPTFNVYKPDISTVTATNYNPGVTNVMLYDSTNRVATGWRGPYMNGGNDSIVDDAWGKPIAAYSATGSRSLVNFWITSYQNTSASAPNMSPFSGISLWGYHDLGSAFGNFSAEVVGAIIKPGPPSTAATGSSLSLASYSNSLSAGLVWTNDYVATLLCNITFNTNALTDASFVVAANISQYYYLAGVIMYGPNPLYNAAAAATYATARPVGVAYVATGGSITATGIGVGVSVNYPNATSVTFIDYPCKFTTGAPSPAYNYPLVQGPRVVKPFLIAQKKSTAAVSTNTATALFNGTARNIVLRPGDNTVQLTIP